jgi:hypothetical protein
MKKYFACLLLTAPLAICMDNRNAPKDEQQNPSTESVKKQEETPKKEESPQLHQPAYRPDLNYRFENGMTIEEAYQAGYEIPWWSLGAAMGRGHNQ